MRSALAFGLTLVLLPAVALAQPEPGWGFTWETVGDRRASVLGLDFDEAGVLWTVRTDSVFWLDLAAGPPGVWRPPGTQGQFDAPGLSILALGLDTLVTAGIGDIARTTNRGQMWTETWDEGREGLYEVPAGHPSAGRLLVGTRGSATGAGYSDDRGASWVAASVTVPPNVTSRERYAFAAVPPADAPPGVPPGVPSRVVGGGNGGVYLSDDGGASWRAGSVFSFPSYQARKAAALARPGGGTRVLVLVDAAGSPDILTFTSDDGGETWAQGPGLAEPPGDGLGWPNPDGLVPLGGSSAMALLGRGRLHRTDDGGATWTEVGQVPRENQFITSRAAALGPDGRLYVSMECSCVELGWVYRTAEVVGWPVGQESPPVPGATGVRLDVRPNPARGTTEVAFTLGAPSAVEVAVYDALGRRVAVLHDGPLAPGAHRVEVGAGRLAPGAYLVRLVAGAGLPPQVAVRRLVVVR